MSAIPTFPCGSSRPRHSLPGYCQQISTSILSSRLSMQSPAGWYFHCPQHEIAPTHSYHFSLCPCLSCTPFIPNITFQISNPHLAPQIWLCLVKGLDFRILEKNYALQTNSRVNNHMTEHISGPSIESGVETIHTDRSGCVPTVRVS